MQADFTTLVREHQDMVFSLAFHYLRDRSDAEELAQEVFFELHRHREPFESIAHRTNWLRKVAVRRCIDYGRRRVRQPKIGLESLPEPSHRPEPSDPFLGEAVRNVVASLPDKQRMVVLLRYQEDLELSEISETLSMPINTVKSCLHRSLLLLREKLERKRIAQ